MSRSYKESANKFELETSSNMWHPLEKRCNKITKARVTSPTRNLWENFYYVKCF